MKKQFTIKDDCTMEDFKMLNPNLLILFSTLLNFARNNDLPVCITSIITDRNGIRTASTTHEEGRAIDISVKGWDAKDIQGLISVMEYHHSNISAISASTLKPRPVVWHDSGYGDHLHLQVKR